MIQSPITFRRATHADADEVAEVFLTSHKAFLPYAPFAHTDDEVRHYIGDILIPHTQVTVPVLDGRIVGLMALKREDGLGWVEQLYIHPDAVGQGLGSQLIEQAKSSLGPPIRLWTFQQNSGARRFYQRHGFRIVTFTDGATNEQRCPDVLFEWEDER